MSPWLTELLNTALTFKARLLGRPVEGRLIPLDTRPALPSAIVRTDWQAALQALKARHARNDALMLQYVDANIAAISTALAGRGPDDRARGLGSVPPEEGVGAHMVVNIASAHVPALCAATLRDDTKPYKNGYDLKHYYRIGDGLPQRAAKSREIVDAALPLPVGKAPSDIYFGAMELNGTGVHFYGDFCLVLRDVDPQTVLLDRNSYDLIRTPIRDVIEVGPPADWPEKRAEMASKISGTWGQSREPIAALKVFGAIGFRARRLTVGQISDAIRDDEDYIEILRVGSFGTNDLSEARLTASDAAQEAAIDSRRGTAPTQPLEALLWRQRRRIAERELRKNGVPVRIVATMGRIKG